MYALKSVISLTIEPRLSRIQGSAPTTSTSILCSSDTRSDWIEGLAELVQTSLVRTTGAIVGCLTEGTDIGGMPTLASENEPQGVFWLESIFASHTFYGAAKERMVPGTELASLKEFMMGCSRTLIQSSLASSGYSGIVGMT